MEEKDNWDNRYITYSIISPLFVLYSDMLQFEFTSQFLHLYKAYKSPLSFNIFQDSAKNIIKNYHHSITFFQIGLELLKISRKSF